MAHLRKLHPLSYLVSGLQCEGLKPVWRLEWALPEAVGSGKSHSPPKEEKPRKANILTPCCCGYNNKNRIHIGVMLFISRITGIPDSSEMSRLCFLYDARENSAGVTHKHRHPIITVSVYE